MLKTPEGGRPLKEYYITLDMAKELSMVENNEKGKEARKYFIECEKKLKNQYIGLSRLELLKQAYEIELQMEQQKQLIIVQQKAIEIQAPKAEFYDEIIESKDHLDMKTIAKTLNMGIGRNKLFELLRQQNILMSDNMPYQRYVDAEYFRVIETKWNKPNGDVCIGKKTVTSQKGLDYIRKLIRKADNSGLLKDIAEMEDLD